MTYTVDSRLVQMYVKLIKDKGYTINDVPNISNLREAVEEALSENAD